MGESDELFFGAFAAVRRLSPSYADDLAWMRLVCHRLEGLVLDVGAGFDVEKLRMLPRDIRYVALDRSAAVGRAFARLRNRPSFEFVHADAEKRLPFPDALFDCVLAVFVLEHLRDDGGAVREMARVLRPGGRLFLMLPAGMRYWSLRDVRAGHLRRYDRDGLFSLFGAGFDVEAVWYQKTVFLWLYKRFVLRRAPSREDAVVEGGKWYWRFLLRLLRPLFALDRWLFWWCPWGMNMVVVARKQGEDGW